MIICLYFFFFCFLEIKIDYVYFGFGIIYYIIVMVCNMVDYCIIVILDGVIMDNSLFSIGIVIDGIIIEDIEY